MNHIWYRILGMVEAVAILVILFALLVPVQDYTLREFKNWVEHPTPETLKAFQDKQREATQFRMTIAASSTTAAILLAFPLLKRRSKTR